MQYRLSLLSDQRRSAETFGDCLAALDSHLEILTPVTVANFHPPACHLEIQSSSDLMALKNSLLPILNEAGFDFILKHQDEADVLPKLLIMDMDSTLVQAETIDQIAAHAGVMDQVSAITESAMRGELDFTQSLLKRVAMLAGIPESELVQVHNSLPLTRGAEQLISCANANDCYTVLVSGGFTYFAQPIADRIGIKEVHANTLEFAEGKLTGKVTGEIVDAEYKQKTLERLISEMELHPDQTIAIGDGANDLLMLGVAGTGIAFHGKPKVQAESEAVINLYGLDAIAWWLGW